MTQLVIHRDEMQCLEHARVFVHGGVVVYTLARDTDADHWRFNIPHMNTQALLLGSGCSLTQAAAAKLREGDVSVAFVGGGSAPAFLLAANHKPTEYAQRYLRAWLEGEERQAQLARVLLEHRYQYLREVWSKTPSVAELVGSDAHAALVDWREQLAGQPIESLRGVEGQLAKRLFAALADRFGNEGFSRAPGEDTDPVNRLLDRGNALAYGLGMSACWALGLPNQFALLHGATRDSGLIFDLADIAKDAVVMPWAFEYQTAETDKAIAELKARFHHHNALKTMITVLQTLSDSGGKW